MGLKEYVGRGGNAGSAVSSLYRAAGSKQPDGDISYVVGIKERNSSGDFVRGSRSANYNDALSAALDVSKFEGYNPKTHELSVEARAKYTVPEEVKDTVSAEKTGVRAGGAAPYGRNSARLTDLF